MRLSWGDTAVDHPVGSEVQGFNLSSKVGGEGGTIPVDILPGEDRCRTPDNPGVSVGSP